MGQVPDEIDAGARDWRVSRRRWQAAPLWLTLALVVVALTALAPRAFAAEPGSPDPTFGTNGVAPQLFTGNGGSDLSEVALQSDGKVVVAGYTRPGANQDFAVARLTPGGQPDTTFSGDGNVTTHLGGSEEVHSLLVQPDGKIVAVGAREPFTNTGKGFQFVRYLPSGALDTTFSGDGKLIVAGGLLRPALDRAYAATLQPDGKIVAVGTLSAGNGVAVVRLSPAGALDRTFSGDGIAVLSKQGASGGYAVGVQPDGRIVVGGTDNETGTDVLLTRFTPAGAVDTTFGSGGSTVTPVSGHFRPVRDLTILPGGRVAVAGEKLGASDSDAMLAVYTPDGVLDPTFSQDGMAVHANPGSSDAATSVVVQSDGKLVVTRTSNGGFSYLLRYLPDGTPDAAFGGDGQVDPNLPWGINDSVLQTDGKLVVSCCHAAARYLLEYSPDHPKCDGQFATIIGTEGADALVGTTGPDVIVAGAGDDVVRAFDGGDIICGGEGNDALGGYGGDDRLLGDAGNDVLVGHAGADSLDGADGIDRVDYLAAPGPVTADLASGTATGDGADSLAGLEQVSGSEYADVLRGTSGVNSLVGRGGDDELDGRDANDTLAGSAGADHVIGGAGSDTVTFAASAAPVTASLALGTATGEGADTITGLELMVGSPFADSLAGDDAGNVLVGGEGDDAIQGAGGNDTLVGQGGADSLGGGAGNDRCDGGTNPAGTADTADATCETKVGIP